MSGPKTASYDLVDILVLAANAYRAQQQAREEARAYERAAQQREQEREREQERQRRRQEQARLAGAQAAADDAERAALRLERLAKSAGIEAAIARPAAPARGDAGALERYTVSLVAETARLEAQLRDSFSRQEEQASATALDRLGHSQTTAELLDAFAAQSRELPAGVTGGTRETRRERALRILGRLSGAAANSIPRDMESLMAELIGAPDDTRAEALELELRLRVQRFNEEQARRQNALAEAAELLASLPDAIACDSVRQELELVTAGLAPLSDSLRARLAEARSAGEEEIADARRKRASNVLSETLQDLGYEVEGIENTLFVEGGIAHFNKAEWGDYCVRLRVDPGDQTVNFNMVRERVASGESSAAADQAAESSWCSGLPQLLNTLEARGLRMKIKRQIAAGAMPVQVVEPGALPESLKAKAQRRTAAPKARTMDS